MAVDGSLIFDTKVDTKGFNAGTKSIQSTIGGLKSGFVKLGAAIGVAFGVKQLVAFSAQAVETASDLQEVQNVVDTAFGDMAYKMEEFADKAVETYGISKLTAKQTGSTFMAMAKGMGLATSASSDMSIALTGLSADMASFYNVEQSVASTALKSIFTGETETLKQFGVVMTETNLQEFARQQGITKTISKMSQAEKVQLRYNYVMKQTALAQGDFAKTSDGWANQTRILSEHWKEFKATIGNLLLTTMLPFVTVTNSLLSKLQRITTTIISIVKSNEDIQRLLKIAVIAAALIPAAALGVKSLAVAKLFLSNILTILITKQITFTTALYGTLGVIALVAGALAVFKLVRSSKNKIDDVTKSTEKANSSLADTTKGLDDISNSLSDVTDESDSFLASFDEINKISSSNTNLIGVDSSQIDYARASLKDLNDEVDNTSFDSVNEGLKGVSDFAQRTVDKIKILFSKEFWSNVLGGLGDIILGIITGDKELILDGIEKIKKSIEDLFGPDWGTFWELISKTVVDILSGEDWDTVVEHYKELKKQIKNPYIIGWLDFWERIGSEIADGILSGDWEGVVNELKSLEKKIEGVFGKEWTDFWENVGAKIYDALHPDEEIGIHVSGSGKQHSGGGGKIPQFATGTVVPANYGEFLAVLGDNKREAEVVSPLSTIEQAVRNAMSGFNGQGGDITIPVYIGTEKIDEIVVSAQRRQRIMGGGY